MKTTIRGMIQRMAVAVALALAGDAAMAQSNVTVTGGVLVTPSATVFATSNAAAFYAAVSNSVQTQIIAYLTNVFGQAQTPVIVPQGSAHVPYQVNISVPERGATIYYTIDGTQPTPGSTQYTGPFWLNYSATVKAYATAPGRIDSATKTAAITAFPASGDYWPIYYGTSANTSLTAAQIKALGVINGRHFPGPYAITNSSGYMYFAWPSFFDNGGGATSFSIAGTPQTMASGSYTNGNGNPYNTVNVNGVLYDVYRSSSTIGATNLTQIQ